MLDRNVKIVTDSSSDLYNLGDIPFASAPLSIMTDERQFLDDDNLNVEEMVRYLAAYNGKSHTSCPNLGDWLTAYGDAEEIFCVTMTRNLSGTYNAACIAAKQYEEEHPGRRVHVINSFSTGGEMVLVVEKIVECIHKGLSFDEICAEIEKYSHKETGLLFMLESMHNLANAGRVSPVVAKFAGMIGIRAIGIASPEGTLNMLDKCRGQARALIVMAESMKKFGYSGGKVRISQCLNPEAAEKMAELVRRDYPDADISIRPCRGLCSVYGELGGVLVGFEKTAD